MVSAEEGFDCTFELVECLSFMKTVLAPLNAEFTVLTTLRQLTIFFLFNNFLSGTGSLISLHYS